jgi:hypothetical protein
MPASSVPIVAEARVPWVSCAERVMMLITPFTALAPHRVPPGPLMTSIRSMSSSIRSWLSQNTPECRGE